MPNADSTQHDTPTRCDASSAAAALQLLFAHLPEPNRRRMVADVLARGEGRLGGLFAIRRGESIDGAIWAEVQPGRTAVVWPPGVAQSAPEGSAAQLIRAAVAYLSAEDVSMAQTLLAPEQTATARAFFETGFEKLTDIVYLAADSRRNVDQENPSRSLQFESLAPDQTSRLASLIERTYVGSLDCPALEGARSIDDVIDGYRATGAFDPSRWWFVRDAELETDAGVLLMTDHPAARQWEIVYMGVAPEARGRGIGRRMVAHGLDAAHRAGAERVVLAVDAENGPAFDVYRGAGFVEWDRRRVLLKKFLNS